MATLTFDAIRDAYIKQLVAQLPHAECETCDHADRSLEPVPADDDGMYRYVMRVTCKRECEQQ